MDSEDQLLCEARRLSENLKKKLWMYCDYVIVIIAYNYIGLVDLVLHSQVEYSI